MATVPTADLVEALRAGKLLEADQLAEAVRLQAAAANGKALASELIRRGWLTPFQANQLLQGRGQELRLGSYLLLERLGEGGMGTVYKARDKLGRTVALKVIRKERLINPQAIKRFQREIRAAATLDHPNIVRAFDADEIDGTHLLVMEYVENGTDLARIVKRDGPLPLATACDTIRQAALGLQHAHERRLVHRDIKPQNLMVSFNRQPTTSVDMAAPTLAIDSRLDGVVKILDMGLARLEHDDTDHDATSTLTHEGAVMGTLDYIAPEQARDSHSADIRADLYSLGCTLFYLLTGQVPFPGGTAAEKLLKHQMDPPPNLHSLRSDVTPEIEALVSKLLAKRPEDRFQTPGKLAQALDHVLAGPVAQLTASPPQQKQTHHPAASEKQLAQRWADVVAPSSETAALVKPPLQFAAATKPLPWRWFAVGGSAALLLLLLVIWQPWRRGGEQANPDANLPSKRKPSAQELAKEKEKKRQQLAEEAETKRQGEAEEALKPLAERVAKLAAGASPAGDTLRKDLREFLMKHSATPAATKACDLLGQVLAKLPSPLDALDAKKLPKDCIDSWKAMGREPPVELVGVLGDHRRRHWGAVALLGYTPDGKTIVSVGDDQVCRLWNTASGVEQVSALQVKEKVKCLALSADRKLLALTPDSKQESITLFDPATGRQIRELEGSREGPDFWASGVFSPDGKLLAAMKYGDLGQTKNDVYEAKPQLGIWDVTTGKQQHMLTIPIVWPAPPPLAFSPDCKTLAVTVIGFYDPKKGTVRCKLHIIDIKSGKHSFMQEIAHWRGGSFQFTPGSDQIVDHKTDYALAVWDLKAGKELRTIDFPVGYRFTLSGDGKHMATAFGNVLDFATGKPRHKLEGAEGVPAFSPDSKHVAYGSSIGTVRLWNVNTGKEVQPLTGHTDLNPGVRHLYSVAFSPDGKTLASGNPDGTIGLWDPNGGSELRTLKGHTGHVASVAFSMDGKTLASGSEDFTVKLWNTAAGGELHALKGHAQHVWSVAFSPDGKTLASGSEDFTVKLWNPAAGSELRTLKGHKAAVVSVAFSPDGKTLASASHDGTVKLWNTAAGSELHTLKGHAQHVWSVAFSPDGKTLASGGHDQTVMLWDPAAGSHRHTLVGHGSDVLSVAFGPDGKTLAAAGMNGRIILWDPLAGVKLREWQLPGPVHGVAFAHDGRHLATANGNGTVYILRIAEGPPRPLSADESRKQQEGEAKRLGVPVQITNSIGMKLNLIPAGRFLMGSPESEPGRQPNEGPRHEVTITKPFYIGVHEATQAEYEKVTRTNPSHFNKANGGGPDHPVEMVSWEDAVAFCKKLSELPEEKEAGRVYRLPTEAEWEYACRAGTRTAYSFGDDPAKLGEYAWYADNGHGKTHPAGQKLPNPWGLHDTHGNVWELCLDCARNYQSTPARDPQGTPEGNPRVARGGGASAQNLAKQCRTASRGIPRQGDRGHHFGFRVVCEVQTAEKK